MRRPTMTSLACLGLVLAAGCAQENAGRSSDDGLTGGDGDGDGDGSGDGDGDGDGSGDGDGDGDGSGDGDGDGDGAHKWDLGNIPDGGDSGCGDGGGGGDGEPEFSYLWAANSSQGTITKIDTQTVTEVGRFIARPDSAGDPSRTSVSASGNVAVANRNSGVSKFYADPDSCADTNGTPGIQTSVNNTPLAWDQEECRAWYQPFSYYTQRPVAWTHGTFNQGTCETENEQLWISGIAVDGGQPEIRLLDGDTGETMETVQLSGWTGDMWGIYGGAVDGDDNFWGSQLGGGSLVRVDYDDLTFELWPVPVGGYGMTVDSDGYVWVCSYEVGRFDPQTETWQTASVGGMAGCMADAGADGLLWMSNGDGVLGVNRQTLAVEKNWSSNGSYGISIDFYGYVWAVAYGSNATRVDPDSGEAITYSGLVGAYTYSDMTGYALKHAGTPDG